MRELVSHPERAESVELCRFRHGLTMEAQNMDDPGRAFSARAIHAVLETEDSPLATLIAAYVGLRKECDVPEKLNILHSSLIYFARLDGRPVPLSPDANHENLTRLTELYQKVTADTATEAEELSYKKFAWALFGRELNTTTASRYAPTEHVIQAVSDRFPDGVRAADIGSSIGLGLKVMALKSQLGPQIFPHVDVLGSRDRVHKRRTAAYNQTLALPPRLKQAYGIDIENPLDPDTQLWAESNLRHKEQANERFMQAFHWLIQAQPDNILFKHVDFTDKNHIGQFIDEVGPQNVDVAIYNTSFYQMARIQQKTALEPLPDMLAPNGIALLQDAVKVTGPGLFDVELDPSSWQEKKRFPWSTLVYDNAHPENGWQPLFHAEDSRFARIRLGSGTLAIRGVQMRPEEWLSAANLAQPDVHLPTPRSAS